MEIQKFKISKQELNGLLFLYHGILSGLNNKSGLVYKNCFKFKKQLNDIIFHFKDKNISDYIEVGEDNEY